MTAEHRIAIQTRAHLTFITMACTTIPPQRLNLLAFPVVSSTGSLPRWWERGISTRRQLNIRTSTNGIHSSYTQNIYRTHWRAFDVRGLCIYMRNYCRCDAVILDPWIMSDGLDLARWKENAHFLPLYLQQNDCWVSSDEITSWFFPHLHHWISILWVYIWTPLTRDQSRGDGARDPFHQARLPLCSSPYQTVATPSTSLVFFRPC